MHKKIISFPSSQTIEQFCHHHQIGRTTYFKLRKAGLGPKEIRAGRVIRITAQAELEWTSRMQTTDSPCSQENGVANLRTSTTGA